MAAQPHGMRKVRGSTPLRSTISDFPKKLREAKGLSQEKLARLADVTNNTIIKIETGESPNPTVDTLEKIAKALGVSAADLFKD
ncbi:MAG: Transcriptional regulator, XRE family [Microgenomates group bacterium GW2011_GWC1_39_7]|nr:MAG: Transcriptional regulator, XRE family [Microgenomates group bacterium GW2011_GWC1_39_7]